MKQKKSKMKYSTFTAVLLAAALSLPAPAALMAQEDPGRMEQTEDNTGSQEEKASLYWGASAGTWENAGGFMRYRKADGSYAAGEIVQIGYQQYAFNTQGQLAAGWIQIDGIWYAADETTGALLTNTWYKNCWLNAAGQYIPQQWQKTYSGWILTLGNGTRAVNGIYTAEDGRMYAFDALGYMQTGWIQRPEGWYYAHSDGKLLQSTSWQGYSFNEKGLWIHEQWIQNNGAWSLMKSDGTMASGGFYQAENGHTYYFNAYGVMQTGWVNTGGSYYYFVSSGEMARNRWVSGKYYLNSQGVWIPNQWQQDPYTGKYRYIWGDGTYPVSQSVEIDGKVYFFDAQGWMSSGGGLVEQNGLTYYKNADGSYAKSTEIGDWYFNRQGIGFSGYDREIARFCDNAYAQTDGTLYGAFRWVVTHVTYQTLPIPLPISYGESEVQNYAKKAMSGQGNCFCYAALFTYMAKGLGYNAIYTPGHILFQDGHWGDHGWVVIYENGVKYYYDPEAQYESPGVNFYRLPAGSTLLIYDK